MGWPEAVGGQPLAPESRAGQKMDHQLAAMLWLDVHWPVFSVGSDFF